MYACSTYTDTDTYTAARSTLVVRHRQFRTLAAVTPTLDASPLSRLGHRAPND